MVPNYALGRIVEYKRRFFSRSLYLIKHALMLINYKGRAFQGIHYRKLLYCASKGQYWRSRQSLGTFLIVYCFCYHKIMSQYIADTVTKFSHSILLMLDTMTTFCHSILLMLYTVTKLCHSILLIYKNIYIKKYIIPYDKNFVTLYCFNAYPGDKIF